MTVLLDKTDLQTDTTQTMKDPLLTLFGITDYSDHFKVLATIRQCMHVDCSKKPVGKANVLMEESGDRAIYELACCREHMQVLHGQRVHRIEGEGMTRWRLASAPASS